MGIDTGNNSSDIRDFNHYKELFDLNATVDDEFNIFFRPDSVKRTKPYQLDSIAKSFDEYASKIRLNVAHLTIDTFYITKSNLDNVNDLSYEVKRSVIAYKTRKYVIDNGGAYFDTLLASRKKIEFPKKDNRDSMLNEIRKEVINYINATADTIYQFKSTATLRISLISIGDTVLKIKKIERLKDGFEFRCLNDADSDGVVDGEDKSNKPGDLISQGYPDYDLDKTIDSLDANDYLYGDLSNSGVPKNYFKYNFSVDGFIGIQINSSQMNLPEPVNTGYNEVDALQSEKGEVSKSKLIPSLNIGGNFRWFFGSGSKRSGISAGFTYTKFTASYEIASPVIYTYKAWDGNYNYRRRITIEAGSKEKITSAVLNVPVLFNYRWMFGKKNDWNFLISAGPSLLMFNGTSDYFVSLSAEGIYQTALNGSDYAITYEDFLNEGANTNVYITGTAINNQNPSPGAATVFELLNDNGYDFKNNIIKSGTQKKLNRTTFAINANADLHYFITKRFAFKGGFSMVYAPLNESSGSYKTIENTYDNYNSLFNAKAKTNYISFGLHAGFINEF